MRNGVLQTGVRWMENVHGFTVGLISGKGWLFKSINVFCALAVAPVTISVIMGGSWHQIEKNNVG